MESAYPIYARTSGWNALLPRRIPNPVLRGEQVADVVIIGAGFTGLACARRWQALAPDARVVVLDSSEIGEGNPGRNSGFLLEVALADDADAESMERMHRCNELTREAMAGLWEDVQAIDPAIDLAKAGTYRAAAGRRGLQALRAYEAFLDAAQLPYRRLDRAALAAELGTEFYAEGLFSPDCYLGQPAAVIRAIAARVPPEVDIYENTPALDIFRIDRRWRVSTPGGEIQSPHLILANNAFARDLGIGRSRLAAVFTYAGLTRRLDPDRLQTLGSNENWGILPAHRLGSTLRRTADGRLLVRSLHDYGHEGAEKDVRHALRRRLEGRFPQFEGEDFEHLWGGAVGFTYNSAPLWGEYEPGLYVACGCNGGGTVKGTLFGRLLADLALGRPVPDIAALFGRASWMPPEPIRGLGFHLRARLESWQGREEL